MKSKTIFIFDFDGTILDNFPVSQNIIKTLAKKYRVPLPDENDLEFKAVWGRGGYNVIKRMFPKENPNKIHQEWKALEKNMTANLTNNTETIIKELKSKNAVVGIITNRSWKSLKHYSPLWKPLNFDFIQTSEYQKSQMRLYKINPFKKHLATRRFKPASGCFEPFFRWLKKREIQPKEIFFIGDCVVDFEAAYNENIRSGYPIKFIGVLTGPLKTQKEWNEITKTNNQFPVLSSIAELPKWLSKQKKGVNPPLFIYPVQKSLIFYGVYKNTKIS